MKKYFEEYYICATCGTQYSNLDNGYCENDHDNWLELDDNIERFIVTSKNLEISIEELIKKLNKNMCTIKKLKEILEFGWKDSSLVKVNGKDIKGFQVLDDNTLFISTEPKIGECNKCGHAVYRNPYYQEGEYLTKCWNCNNIITEKNLIKIS